MLETALIGVGIASGIWWPDHGPGCFVRERLLRPVVKRLGAESVCDCIICLSFWCGVYVSALGVPPPGPLPRGGGEWIAAVGHMAGSGFISLGLAFAMVQVVGVRREARGA